KLNPFAALIVMLAQAVTVHFYALVGVPVSTSQAVVGAVLGISFIKGLQTLNFPLTGKIFLGWITTPVAAGLLAAAMFYLGRTWLA
ncbi:MAG TPA: inorganic phosphate transporter, partial [Spirochaetota bacterium]|nr:inorganic phosphate transporter [Spirochaetota bacterium]